MESEGAAAIWDSVGKIIYALTTTGLLAVGVTIAKLFASMKVKTGRICLVYGVPCKVT